MGFLDNLKLTQGDGSIVCKSKYNRLYWTAIATTDHQCKYCGKMIKTGKQLFTSFSSFELGQIMVSYDANRIEKAAKSTYCSLDCFRKGN